MENDISSTQLASRSDNSLDSIKKNIKRNMSYLETIAHVKIENVKTEAGQTEKVFWLNVFQAWYVVSSFKNTPKNRRLKMDLTESVSKNTDMQGAWKGTLNNIQED
ncbi:hypothetical protein [Lactiplantibacillus plantarum]|jgi:hypothetical protein|uniref:hypothetical protein n=1 Tax=Lactiplantibacillus plantarum TaxID=1590 RepID=UPI000CBF759F|nr:hypothetical protein [Lactiplantibacillus plantarum]PME02953.1 hypothetical protein S101520_00095 [Lactiplantibacillus plantarum subsp. plantarum]DAV14461.1 MAG TPA: hypothetical protein [Caudoviricetes sp.]